MNFSMQKATEAEFSRNSKMGAHIGVFKRAKI